MWAYVYGFYLMFMAMPPKLVYLNPGLSPPPLRLCRAMHSNAVQWAAWAERSYGVLSFLSHFGSYFGSIFTLGHFGWFWVIFAIFGHINFVGRFDHSGSFRYLLGSRCNSFCHRCPFQLSFFPRVFVSFGVFSLLVQEPMEVLEDAGIGVDTGAGVDAGIGWRVGMDAGTGADK